MDEINMKGRRKNHRAYFNLFPHDVQECLTISERLIRRSKALLRKGKKVGGNVNGSGGDQCLGSPLGQHDKHQPPATFFQPIPR
jgi:hypothetical protein